MPSVGKMSRGICRNANSAPNTTAMTATTTVSGLRMAGVRRFIVKFECRKFRDSVNAVSLNLCQGFARKTRGSRWVSAVRMSSTQDEAEHAALANLALDLDAPALTSFMTCGTGVVWKTESALRRGGACATSLQASAKTSRQGPRAAALPELNQLL